MIKFDGVNYIYNQGLACEKKALDNVNIEIDENKIIGLIGKSGSGKSTFVQLFNKLLKPTSGKIFIDKKRIGLVFQYAENQIFEMTVEEEIGFGIKKYAPEKKIKKILEVLDLVGLDKSYLKKNPFELSGGEKRKVAIAGILVLEPEILILDEPTVGLDLKSQKEILENIKNLKQKFNMTVIIVSHDMNVISEFCDKVIFLRDRKIIFYGDTYKVFDLNDFDLELPWTKKLAKKLVKKNFFVPENIILFDDLVEYVAKKIREKKN